MKRHGITYGANSSSGKTFLSSRWNGRGSCFFENNSSKVLPAVFADPVTGLRNDEVDIVDAFQDTIRGSVYELYKKRGWEPEGD